MNAEMMHDLMSIKRLANDKVVWLGEVPATENEVVFLLANGLLNNPTEIQRVTLWLVVDRMKLRTRVEESIRRQT